MFLARASRGGLSSDCYTVGYSPSGAFSSNNSTGSIPSALARGLTQETLAVDAGIDRTYVSRLERGLQNPTVAVLEKLARALSSNIEELFGAPRAAEAPSRSPA